MKFSKIVEIKQAARGCCNGLVRLATAGVLALSLLNAPASARDKNWNPTNDAVYKSLNRKLDSMFTRTDIDLALGERGRLFAWTWGYLGRAALHMHKATGEERFLTLVRDTSYRLLRHRDDAIGQFDEVRGKIVPSWQTKFPWGGKSNEITTAGLITLPMCQYAVQTGDHEIGREAVKSLAEFIDDRKEAHGGYYFWHESQQAIEALNHAHIYGAALAHCSKLSYAPESFTETALGIYRYWRYFTRPDGKGLSWAYMPGPDSPRDQKSEAVWKFGVTIELPIALVKLGIMKDDGIMKELRDTFVENTIVKAGGIPQFIGEKKLVDISQVKKFEKRSSAGLISPVVLMDDPDVTQAFQRMVKTHPKLFLNGWFGGSKSMMFTYAYLLEQNQKQVPVKTAAQQQPIMTCETQLKKPFLFSTHAKIHSERLKFIENRLTKERYSTIGIGDSIMQRWPNEMLQKSYGGNVLNAGVGGDGIPQLMFRLRNMSFASQSPEKVIIHIGTNDFPRKAAGCAVANGVGDVIAQVRKMWPQVNVVVHSILPRGNYVGEFADKIKIVNDNLRNVSKERGFSFVDLASVYVPHCLKSIDCDILEGVKDVHPNLTAYEQMTDVMASK